jgi:hypothetical protein
LGEVAGRKKRLEQRPDGKRRKGMVIGVMSLSTRRKLVETFVGTARNVIASHPSRLHAAKWLENQDRDR